MAPQSKQAETLADNPSESRLIQLQAARDAAMQAARAAVRDTTRLTRLLAILSEPGEMHDLLDRALATLSELFIADIIILIDPIGTGSFLPLASVGLPESMITEPFSNAPGSYLRSVMQEQKPRVLHDLTADPNIDHRFHELDVNVLVGLPVLGEKSVRGVLAVARCSPEPFADSEIDLLTTMAYRLGLTLEDNQRKIQLEEIIQSGNVIGRHLDSQIIAAEAARSIQAIARADIGATVLRTAAGDFCCAALCGAPQDWAPALCQLASSLALTTEIVADAPYSTDRLQEVLRSLEIGLSVTPTAETMLALPIHHNGELAGMLFAFRFEPLAFHAITLQMGMLYANYVSASLENALLYQAGKKELSERIKADQALRASDNRFRALMRSVSDIIAVVSPTGMIGYINPAAEMVWGCPEVTLPGQNIHDFLHDDDRTIFRQLLQQIEQGDEKTDLKGGVRCLGQDRQWRFYEVTLANLAHEPAVNGIVATFHDVTERNLYEKELTKLAYQDPLTGLANRAHFMERLHASLAQANMLAQPVALIFFDVDNFKAINDTHGHASGDVVLCAMADRVRACLRRNDLAARLGGDEFTILIEDIDHAELVLPMVERLLSLLMNPIRLDHTEVIVGVSLGIALSTMPEDTAASLLGKADRAMYHAKLAGKGQYAIFSEAMLSTGKPS